MSGRPGVGGEHGKIRVAVVGAGEFGRNHARVYREMDTVELVGVVDQDAARAEKIAQELGFARSKDWRIWLVVWMRPASPYRQLRMPRLAAG